MFSGNFGGDLNLNKGLVKKYGGGGGDGPEQRGVGHEVLILVQGVGHPILLHR